jgi:hypothetical protein
MYAELAHQRRAMLPLRWLITLVIWSALAISMISYWGEFVGAITVRDAAPIAQALAIPMIFLTITALVVHFGVIIQTLVLAFDSIAREKAGGTWDNLVLTHMRTRHIILGKWWATVRRMRGGFVLAALLAVGPMVAMQTYAIRYFASGFYAPRVWGHDYYVVSWPTILLAGVLIVAFSQVSLGLTAAIGVVAPLVSWRKGIGIALAIISYIVTITVFAGMLYLIPDFLRAVIPSLQFDYTFRYFFLFPAVTLVDGGSLLASLVVAPLSRVYDTNYVASFACYIGSGLALYLIPTWLALHIAESLAARQGALRQGRILRPQAVKKTRPA